MELSGVSRTTRGGIGIGTYATTPTIRGGVMAGARLGTTTTIIRTLFTGQPTIRRITVVAIVLRMGVRA